MHFFDDDLVEILVYQDDVKVAVIRMHRGYVEKLALENGLESFLEESLCYYTCVDGPVFLIWGSSLGKTRIVGITLKVEELRKESALRQAWEQYKSTSVSIKDIHDSILKVLNQVLN